MGLVCSMTRRGPGAARVSALFIPVTLSLLGGCSEADVDSVHSPKLVTPPEAQAAVDQARSEADAPAFAAVVVRGVETFAAVSGSRAFAASPEVTLQDPWHIGSVTKMMTATLVARFVERGLLTWDTTLEDVLGDVEPEMHPQYRRATLVHVLAHRTGMQLTGDGFGERMAALTQAYLEEHGAGRPPPLGFAEGDFTGDATVDRLHWTRAALREPPAALLGAPRRIYENGNYVIAATVLEHRTGRSWEELMVDELFGPLGMNGAGFGPPGGNDPITAPIGHTRTAEGEVTAYPPEGPERPDNPPVLGPSGRVHLTLADMAAFMRDQIRGHRGSDGLLSASTYQVLHTPPFGDDYAFGWIERESGGLGHGGTNGKWLAVVEIRPEADIGVFVATNLGPPEATASAADVLMEKLFAEFHVAGPPE